MNKNSFSEIYDTVDHLKPHLFIGVGGTGLEVLKDLKALNQNKYHGDLENFEYLSIDTRDNSSMAGPLDENERHDLSASEIVQDVSTVLTNMESSYPGIADWFPDVTKWSVLKDFYASLEGANQCRALGRLMLYLDSEQVRAKIRRKIRDITDSTIPEMLTKRGIIGTTQPVHVYIIGSICGGTGSGQFIDLAYIVHDAGKSHGNIHVDAVLGLPQLFSNVPTESIEKNNANAYAALRELNHYMTIKDYSVKFPGNSEISMKDRAPFKQIYLINSPNSTGVSFRDRADACRMVARGLYGFSASMSGKRYAEIFTNPASNLRKTIRNSKGTNFLTAYSSFGVSAIEFPVDKIVTSLSLRFAYEMCSWLKKEVTPDQATSMLRQGLDKLWQRLEVNPSTMKDKLKLANSRKQFQAWLGNVSQSVGSAKDGKLKKFLVSERESLLDERYPSQERQLDVFANEIESEMTKSLDRFFIELIDGPLDEALNLALDIALEAQQELEKEFRTQLTDELAHQNSLEKTAEAEYSRWLNSVDELLEQGFLKNLVDFDKDEQLSEKSTFALSAVKNQAGARLEAHASQKILEIYNHINGNIDKWASTVKELLGLLSSAGSILHEQYKLKSRIPARDGVTYSIVGSERLESVYQEVISKFEDTPRVGAIRELTQSKPLSQWSNEFTNAEALADYILKEHAEILFKDNLEKRNIVDELQSTGMPDRYITSNLIVPSEPFINISTGELGDKGQSVIFKQDILGVEDANNISKTISKQVGTFTPSSTNDNKSIHIIQTVHAYPVFAIDQITGYKAACDNIRNSNDNPCYTMQDQIINGFQEITFDAVQTISDFHRAVHAFDLGVSLGFLAKKQKGRVYYFCETKNDLTTGFTIGSPGGGRRKSIEWLMDPDNRTFLEKLENKIRTTLLGMSSQELENFQDEWAVFKNKAIARSERETEWQSWDGKSIPHYPKDGKDPAILRKITDLTL